MEVIMKETKEYIDNSKIAGITFLQILDKHQGDTELCKYAQSRYAASVMALRCHLSLGPIMDYRKSKPCQYKNGHDACPRPADSQKREDKKKTMCPHRGQMCIMDEEELLLDWATAEYNSVILGLDGFDPQRVSADTKRFYEMVRKGVRLS